MGRRGDGEMGTRMKQIRLIETRMITDFNTELLYHFLFQVSGFKFQVSGLKFQVSGLKFQV